MLSLTVTSGMLDAVSFFSLDQVFVGMMTGNIIVFGFALGGAPHFTEPAPLLAIAGFTTGIAATGVALRYTLTPALPWLRCALTAEAFLLLASAGISSLTQVHCNAIIVLLSVAMGLHCAAIRHLAVPELRTTFAVTGALLSLLHDTCSGAPPHAARRLGVIGATAAGAAIGTVALTYLGRTGALLAAAVIVAGAATVTHRLAAPLPSSGSSSSPSSPHR
ncbi:YoaK family protein [Streptomyces noursei]|uniref:YoaK family protein n=1 Tax=Streptomyces TaxID=1883 RepID=UPI0035DF8A96